MLGHTLSRHKVKDDSTKWRLCERHRRRGTRRVFLVPSTINALSFNVFTIHLRTLITDIDIYKRHFLYRYLLQFIIKEHRFSIHIYITFKGIRYIKFQMKDGTIKFHWNNRSYTALKSPSTCTINIRRHDITC